MAVEESSNFDKSLDTVSKLFFVKNFCYKAYINLNTKHMAAESINDEIPKIEKLNKIQRKKVMSLLEQHVDNPEAAHAAVKEYCNGLSKIKFRGVVLNQNKTPNEIEVITVNTTHFFKLKATKAEDK